jgi:uncharacterized protein YjhX (UPF0386 family)
VKRPTPKPDRQQVPEIISATECYTLREFLQRAGLSVSAWRQVKRKGMAVHVQGKRLYVLGSDFLDFLKGVS